MMYACRFNKTDSLNILMFYHCQTINKVINFQNKSGDSVIHFAARYKSVECMEKLLECPYINVNLQEYNVK